MKNVIFAKVGKGAVLRRSPCLDALAQVLTHYNEPLKHEREATIRAMHNVKQLVVAPQAILTIILRLALKGTAIVDHMTNKVVCYITGCQLTKKNCKRKVSNNHKRKLFNTDKANNTVF